MMKIYVICLTFVLPLFVLRLFILRMSAWCAQINTTYLLTYLAYVEFQYLNFYFIVSTDL